MRSANRGKEVLFSPRLAFLASLVFVLTFPAVLFAEGRVIAAGDDKRTAHKEEVPLPGSDGVEEKRSAFCPQKRTTPKAPDSFYGMKNPLDPTEKNYLAGKTLFHFDVKPTPCRVCHGLTGNGLGIVFKEMIPKPRNFTCYQTMKDIPDGQLFWVIKNGSPGTDMPAFKELGDDQVWQLILYIRHFEE